MIFSHFMLWVMIFTTWVHIWLVYMLRKCTSVASLYYGTWLFRSNLHHVPSKGWLEMVQMGQSVSSQKWDFQQLKESDRGILLHIGWNIVWIGKRLQCFVNNVSKTWKNHDFHVFDVFLHSFEDLYIDLASVLSLS